MNLSEFETSYRNAIAEMLTQLQTTVILLPQLESRITNVAQDLQSLSLKVEEFVTEKRAEQAQTIKPKLRARSWYALKANAETTVKGICR